MLCDIFSQPECLFAAMNDIVGDIMKKIQIKLNDKKNLHDTLKGLKPKKFSTFKSKFNISVLLQSIFDQFYNVQAYRVVHTHNTRIIFDCHGKTEKTVFSVMVIKSKDTQLKINLGTMLVKNQIKIKFKCSLEIGKICCSSLCQVQLSVSVIENDLIND